MTQLKRGTFMLMPVAAMTDTRLAARHYRVLAAIAFHDRLGKNGRHCNASQATLAREAGMARQSANSAIRELIKWGHVVVIRDDGPGRKRELGVVYPDFTCHPYATGPAPEPVTKTKQVAGPERVTKRRQVDEQNGTVSAGFEGGSYIYWAKPHQLSLMYPDQEGKAGRVQWSASSPYLRTAGSFARPLVFSGTASR